MRIIINWMPLSKNICNKPYPTKVTSLPPGDGYIAHADAHLSSMSLSVWRTGRKCMRWGQVYTSAVNSQQIVETELFSLLVIKSLSVKSYSSWQYPVQFNFIFQMMNKMFWNYKVLIKLTNYHGSKRNSQPSLNLSL